MTAAPAPGQGPDRARDEAFLARVSGRVQGVGFRYFTVRAGRRLGLGGQVRNLPDGRVEVYATGPRAELEQLADQLRRGPGLGRVDQMEIDWNVPVRPAPDFTIGY